MKRERRTHGKRPGIIAGGGSVPVKLAAHLKQSGLNPFVFLIEGEAPSALNSFDHASLRMGDFAGFIRRAKTEDIDTFTLIGNVGSRPNIGHLRPTWGTLKFVLAALRSLKRGDDALLKFVVAVLEHHGFGVVGVHELLPDLIAELGAFGSVRPTKAHRDSIEIGIAAAKSLGEMDAGQGVVVIGKRVVALEGAEGTDAMLDRVAHLREIGRLPKKRGGVLVKLSKPGQELRVDMPATGLGTVERAIEAKLDGIVVEAGATLVIDRQEMIACADAEQLFLYGADVDG